MNVLAACEFSGKVRNAFRAKGHDAWSIDLEPAYPFSVYHMTGNVTQLNLSEWDLVIAFPPCTFLAASGARWWRDRPLQQRKALAFVQYFMDADVPRLAIENPVGRISTAIRKPDQIIQPWMFGEDASKATCLWLKGLPKLQPTQIIKKARYANQTKSGQNNLSPSPERGRLRSITYDGIANAMASQWGAK